MVQISEMPCLVFLLPFFSVSNGVCQGIVLSPLLFAVLYIDELLSDLSSCGVGCYCGDMLAGCVCYADDIVLLAPCQSAICTLLSALPLPLLTSWNPRRNCYVSENPDIVHFRF